VSVASGPDITSQIDWETAPRLAVGVSTDVALVRRVTHEQTLRGLRNGLEWRYAADREHVFTMLRDTKAHLVYFYCHGGMSGKVPYIQVGPPTERGITIDNLRYKHIIWDRPRPLVFINGCHTTALEPRVALEMVSGFVEKSIRGNRHRDHRLRAARNRVRGDMPWPLPRRHADRRGRTRRGSRC